MSGKKSGTQTKRESRAVRSKRCQQWQGGGLPKAEFCKREGLNATCFYCQCGILQKASLEQAVIQTDPAPDRPTDLC